LIKSESTAIEPGSDANNHAPSPGDLYAVNRIRLRAKHLWTLSAILALSVVLYLLTMNPSRFGTYHDDGIYVTTAKAIATGQGYRIVSLPFEPSETKYPPLYPFLLSVIWRLNSSFPQNLIPMIWLSIAATTGFLALSWRYLIINGYASASQSSIVVFLAAVNTWTIVFSTSVITEMLYAMLSVAGLYLAEKLVRRTAGWFASVSAGLVCGLAFLTRTSGVTLVLAVAVYLMIRRAWKPALVSFSVALVFVICWTMWVSFNRTTIQGVNVAFYTNYFKDVREIIGSLETLNSASELSVLLTIVGKNFLGLTLVSIPLVCSGINNLWKQGSHGVIVMMCLFFVIVIFMLIVTNIIRRISEGLRLLYLYLIFYLALHLATPYTTYDRYLIPLLPFLLVFLIAELSRLFAGVRSQLKSRNGLGDLVGGPIVGLAALATICVMSFAYLKGIQLQMGSSARTSAAAQEETQLTQWIISNTELSDTLICYRDPVYYLRTGRKAARSVPTALIDGALFQHQPPTVEEEKMLIRSIISENNGRYLIVSLEDFDHLPESYRSAFTELTSQEPARFIPVFESASGRSTIYRIESSAG